MAGSSLFVLIDDIAALLDDVALMTKVAAKKTTGVLGDDLALNAQQLTGISADRELPIIWSVAKGSFKNKFILVPMAMLISAFIPWLIMPLLMIGGAYLCFEGFEKVLHTFAHKPVTYAEAEFNEPLPSNLTPEFEAQKIKGAIRTDFILSAEIIVIALGVVSHLALPVQALVLAVIAIAVTIGVYGIVAAIVKLDDLGLYLLKNNSATVFASIKRKLGLGLVNAAPKLMKLLGVVGTVAMFLVGGEIIAHGLPFVHHLQLAILAAVAEIAVLPSVLSLAMNMFVGGLAGGLVFVLVSLASALKNKAS